MVLVLVLEVTSVLARKVVLNRSRGVIPDLTELSLRDLDFELLDITLDTGVEFPADNNSLSVWSLFRGNGMM